MRGLRGLAVSNPYYVRNMSVTKIYKAWIPTTQDPADPATKAKQ